MLDSLLVHAHSLWDSLPDEIKKNQFLGGGFILGLATVVLNAIRSWPARIWERLRREFMIEVTINQKDEAFTWIKEWLSAQDFTKRSRNLDISLHQVSRYAGTQDVALAAPMDGPTVFKRPRPRFILSPGYGTHIFFYKGRMVWLTRSKDEGGGPGTKAQADNFSKMFAMESIHMRFFSRSRSIVAEMLNDVIDTVLLEEGLLVSTYYSYGIYNGWRVVNKRKQLNVRNLILPDGVFEDLVADVRKFMDDRDWYERMGLAHRRGYMLHGIPGSGKSTTVLALAAVLEMDLAILSLNVEGMDDAELINAITRRPVNSLLLLEDVDCATKKREIEDKGSKITFSGLLNAIDGVISADGTILFMTTNHLEHLDPALIRPGRVDRKIAYGAATASQASRMFSHFFPGTNGAGEAFASAVGERELTMCRLQEHLVRHREDWKTALEAARDPVSWEESEA